MGILPNSPEIKNLLDISQSNRNLVFSKNSSLTNQQVRNILDKSAVDLGTSGRDAYFGYGKVNPYGALQQTP
jgi:hypothetical protein